MTTLSMSARMTAICMHLTCVGREGELHGEGIVIFIASRSVSLSVVQSFTGA